MEFQKIHRGVADMAPILIYRSIWLTIDNRFACMVHERFSIIGTRYSTEFSVIWLTHPRNRRLASPQRNLAKDIRGNSWGMTRPGGREEQRFLTPRGPLGSRLASWYWKPSKRLFIRQRERESHARAPLQLRARGDYPAVLLFVRARITEWGG
jgi:hypothetical protein